MSIAKDEFDRLFSAFQSQNSGAVADLSAVAGLPTMPVVLLVHGIDGNAAHWSKPLTLSSDSTWLYDKLATPLAAKPFDKIELAFSPDFQPKLKIEGDNYRSWCRALTARSFSFINYSQADPHGYLKEAADELKVLLRAISEQIYAKLDEADRPPLVILCHSRGGLVTRLALKELDPVELANLPLSKVISLCTPHRGSYLPKLSQDYDTLTNPATLEQLASSLLGPFYDLVRNDNQLKPLLDNLETLLKNAPGRGAASSPGYLELIPGSPALTELNAGEKPLPGVSYYSVAGSVPAFLQVFLRLSQNNYLTLLSISDGLLVEKLVSLIPKLTEDYGGLAELAQGDSCVALPSSRWPDSFQATPRIFPVHHMEALIDYPLQSAVLNLLQGKGFMPDSETALAEFERIVEIEAASRLKDPAAEAIHDAMLMGATNIELKSRLQIALRNRQIAAFNPAPASSGAVLQAVLPGGKGIIDTILGETDKFIGGSTSTKTGPASSDNTLLGLTSVWKALFNRLAALHQKHFPGSNTANTVYDLDDNASPYLKSELANAGVRRLSTDPEGQDSFLESFKLYDYSRRTLNCLIWLYSDASQSLIPQIVLENQRQLISQVLEIPNYAGADLAQNLTGAIEKLTALLVKFLEAWDAYLREQFFSGGQFKNDDIELIAYEAGRALTSLSWGVSVKTVPLENILQTLQAFQPDALVKSLQQVLDKLSGLDGYFQNLLNSFQQTATATEPNNPKGQLLNNVSNAVRAFKESLTPPRTRFQSSLASVSGKTGDDQKQAVATLATNPANRLTDQERSQLKVGQQAVEQQLLASNAALEVVFPSVTGGLRGSLQLALQAVQDWESSLSASQIILKIDPKSLEEKIKGIWAAVFDRDQIIELQHQISALSVALDEAYYRVNQETLEARAGAGDLVGVNPDLPSQGIHAVRHSLDYWQRTISLIAPPDPTAATPVSPTTQPQPRLDLSEDSTWYVQLRQSLIQQFSVWQNLVSSQQSLQSFSATSVTETMLSDFMGDLEDAGSRVVLEESGKLLARYWWVVVAFLVVIIVGLTLLLVNSQSDILKGTVVGLVAGVGAAFSGLGLNAVRGSGSGSNITTTASTGGIAGLANSVLGLSSSALTEAFTRGYNQVRLEFAYLDYNMSVTFPLLEFFIRSEVKVLLGSESQAINNGYQFLSQVIWTSTDRDEEVKRVVRAAFGPIGGLIGTYLTEAAQSQLAAKRASNK